MKFTPVLGINDYKTKDGKKPIYIKVNVGQKRKLIPVNAKIEPWQWDEKDGRVKLGTHPNATTINLKIIDLCTSIEKNYINDESVEAGDKGDFYWWFEERLKYTKKFHSIYNYEKLLAIKKKLQEFAPSLPIRKLDYLFLLNFEKHLKGIGNSTNTIADNMMRIRIIVNMIISSGKLEAHKSPFNNYVSKTTKVKKNRVKMEVIELLEKTNFGGDPAKQLAVDMYLYSFFNAGIRFGDLCRIKTAWIVNDRLKYQMHKSSVDRSIKQMPQALRIIKKYKGEEYLFDTGVMWRKNNTIKEIHREEKHINSRNSFFNDKLEEVCEELEIPKITFHSSRHSFADYTKEKKFGKKFDIHTLKDLFGHKKVSTTEGYMKEFYEEESDEAMDQLFGSSAKKRTPLTEAKRSKARK